MAFVTLQSLNIIKIVDDTSKVDQEEREEHTLLKTTTLQAISPILSTYSFGFTIGAPRPILDSIARITQLRKKRRQGNAKQEHVDEMLASELNVLNRYRKEQGPESDCWASNRDSTLDETVEAAAHQKQAFIQATYIYLYRSLLEAPPEAVKSYVATTFAHVFAFFSTSDGNFSIWPAFIAAVEAFTEDNIAAARQWLESAVSFGIGSRESMRCIVEEVWRRRNTIAQTSGLRLGLIAVDWREVMQELGIDILLV